MIDLGSHVATPKSSEKFAADKKISHVSFPSCHVENLESWIDDWDTKLPPLTNFILPSGGLAASQLHISRTVCRRAERDLVVLFEAEEISPEAYQYVNRLSDYLFMLARTCAMTEGKTEVIYKKAKVE